MRQDVYRAAYQEANAELNEIMGKFEQLRQKKERVEKMIEMLKSMADIDITSSASIPQSAERTPDPPPQFSAQPQPAPPVQQMADAPVYAMQAAEVPAPEQPAERMAEPSSDPFQRRIDSALGLAGGFRESREFGRRFIGGLQRG